MSTQTMPTDEQVAELVSSQLGQRETVNDILDRVYRDAATPMPARSDVEALLAHGWHAVVTELGRAGDVTTAMVSFRRPDGWYAVVEDRPDVGSARAFSQSDDLGPHATREDAERAARDHAARPGGDL